jgi:ankyrin repeat protein
VSASPAEIDGPTTGAALVEWPPALEAGGTTPSMVAWEGVRKQMVEMVDNEYNPTTPSQTMYFTAAMAGDRGLIDWLSGHGGRIDGIDPFLHVTALHMAVLNRQTTAVQVLLEAGAWTGSVDQTSGAPVLIDAANLNHVAILKLLLDHGADPNIRQWGLNVSALHAAAVDGEVEVARLLLDHGADPSAVDARGVTPLHLAIQLRQAAMVRLLLERGADPNKASSQGVTPLAVAGRTNQTETIALLKKHGATEEATGPTN